MLQINCQCLFNTYAGWELTPSRRAAADGEHNGAVNIWLKSRNIILCLCQRCVNKTELLYLIDICSSFRTKTCLEMFYYGLQLQHPPCPGNPGSKPASWLWCLTFLQCMSAARSPSSPQLFQISTSEGKEWHKIFSLGFSIKKGLKILYEQLEILCEQWQNKVHHFQHANWTKVYRR